MTGGAAFSYDVVDSPAKEFGTFSLVEIEIPSSVAGEGAADFDMSLTRQTLSFRSKMATIFPSKQ